MNTSNDFFVQAKQILKSIAAIISWTLFALLVLIIGFLIYYLVCTNVYAAKGEKYEPKFSLYTIVSPSMEPQIKVYDVILNMRVDDKKTIKVGDVITFISTSNISSGMTVTHRVTEVINGTQGLEFKTKGDNNLTEDTDTAKASNVLGKVVLKIPQLGRLQFFIASNGGWLIVIIIPALFIIINDILKIIKLKKAKNSIEEVNEETKNDRKIEMEEARKEEIKKRLSNGIEVEKSIVNEDSKTKNETKEDLDIPIISNLKNEQSQIEKKEDVNNNDDLRIDSFRNNNNNIFDEEEKNDIFSNNNKSQKDKSSVED